MSDEEYDTQAHVRLARTAGLTTVFLRLDSSGQLPQDSIEALTATVDVDHSGRPVGLYVSWRE